MRGSYTYIYVIKKVKIFWKIILYIIKNDDANILWKYQGGRYKI